MFYQTISQALVSAMSATLLIAGLASGCAAQTSALQRSSNVSSPAAQTQTSTAPNPDGLMDPAKAVLPVPAEFYAQFETSKGNFVVHVHRDWAPQGASRFYNMIQSGYFDSDIAIFRAIEGFMFQFGIHGDPAVNAKWANATIPDDPANGKSNSLGTLSFAQTQLPNSRSVQIFVNLGQNSGLDSPQGKTGSPFVPFAEIVSGSEVMRKIYTGDGENPRGENIQGNFKAKGNAYIFERFKNIDKIRKVTIVQPATK